MPFSYISFLYIRSIVIFTISYSDFVVEIHNLGLYSHAPNQFKCLLHTILCRTTAKLENLQQKQLMNWINGTHIINTLADHNGRDIFFFLLAMHRTISKLEDALQWNKGNHKTIEEGPRLKMDKKTCHRLIRKRWHEPSKQQKKNEKKTNKKNA